MARGKDQTEVMQRVRWDAPQWVGQKVFLRVVDRETRGWGHVTLDDFSARGRIDAEETQRRFAEIEDPAGAAAAGDSDPRMQLAGAAPGDRGSHGDACRRSTRAERSSWPGSMPWKNGSRRPRRSRRRALSRSWRRCGARPWWPTRWSAASRIVFVVRHQYRSHYHAIDTLFHTAELNADRGMTPHADLFQGGAALKTIDLTTGRVQTLVDVPDGVVRDPEVHFDGQRIVFAMRRNRDEDYHIWEIAATARD